MDKRPLVYTALSKHSYFAKELVCAHAFNNGVVPLNPFSMFGYFLFDLVDRDLVRGANGRVIDVVDEVWSYGPVADGCLAEFIQAWELGKPVKFFSVAKRTEDIKSITIEELEFESPELKTQFFEHYEKHFGK